MMCAESRPPTTRMLVSNTDTFTFASTSALASTRSTARMNSVSLPMISSVSSASISVRLKLPQVFMPEEVSENEKD